MTNNQLELTPKAQRTRQHILDTALSLFTSNGYEATTMREIAIAADCSLGLTYRYFARKEELILAVYWQMAADTGAQIALLPSSSIAERFHQLMSLRLSQAIQFREPFRALFGTALNPNSGIDLLGTDMAQMRGHVRQAFVQLLTNSSDAPPKTMTDNLATLIYSLHFAIILFWLYDRSADQRITADLLAFTRDGLVMARRMLRLPFMRQAIGRLAGIMEAVFVGS
jgi:AcrR family transcriptional regulator